MGGVGRKACKGHKESIRGAGHSHFLECGGGFLSEHYEKLTVHFNMDNLLGINYTSTKLVLKKIRKRA